MVTVTKLAHVGFRAKNLSSQAEFYNDRWGLERVDEHGGELFFRADGPDHHVLTLHAADAPGLHHFAFEVPTLAEVIRARDCLRAHNVKIDFDGRRRAGVQIAVEFRDPDGHRLEIYWGIDQIGSDGRARPAEEWKGAQSLEAAIADPVIGQDTTLADPSLLGG